MSRSAIEILAVAWPQEMSVEQIELYFDMLADVPGGELTAALEGLARTSKWRPSIAEIRRAVLDARGVVPSGHEALLQAELLDAWEAQRSVPWGAQARPPERPEVHPTVLAAWTAVGADAIPAVFARAWREEREVFVVRVLSAPMDRPFELGVGDAAAE